MANDSSVTLGAGGLVLTKNADIAMRSEDLTISPTRVDVRYVFVNESGRDLDEMVAFPLPDIDYAQLWEAPRGAMTEDPVNFVGFKATADGKPIAVSVEQRALLKGRDVTSAVKAAGLPVNLSNDAGVKLLDGLANPVRATLKAEGLVEWNSQYDYIRPNWTVSTKFYWQQHFAAGKPVTITHRYQPVTGQAFFTEADLEPADGTPSQYVGPYCMDAGTRAFARKHLAAGHQLSRLRNGAGHARRLHDRLHPDDGQQLERPDRPLPPDARQAEAGECAVALLGWRSEEDGAGALRSRAQRISCRRAISACWFWNRRQCACAGLRPRLASQARHVLALPVGWARRSSRPYRPNTR